MRGSRNKNRSTKNVKTDFHLPIIPLDSPFFIIFTEGESGMIGIIFTLREPPEEKIIKKGNSLLQRLFPSVKRCERIFSLQRVLEGIG